MANLFFYRETSTAEFKGSLADLQAELSKAGCVGNWTEIAHGHQFKSTDGGILNWFPATGKINFQGGAGPKAKLQGLLASLSGESVPAASTPVTTAQAAPKSKVFVVHGHDTVAREQLELVLHKLGLDPFVLANTGGGGLTIIEALEKTIAGRPAAARFGIVLMTPDDIGYTAGLIQSPSQASLRGLSAWAEVGGIASSL